MRDMDYQVGRFYQLQLCNRDIMYGNEVNHGTDATLLVRVWQLQQ